MINSVATLTKLVIFLFSYYKTRALIRLPCLFLVTLGMTARANVIVLIKYIPFSSANTTICHIHIGSVILGVITSTNHTTASLNGDAH
jgi:hypothetical protein